MYGVLFYLTEYYMRKILKKNCTVITHYSGIPESITSPIIGKRCHVVKAFIMFTNYESTNIPIFVTTIFYLLNCFANSFWHFLVVN